MLVTTLQCVPEDIQCISYEEYIPGENLHLSYAIFHKLVTPTLTTSGSISAQMLGGRLESCANDENYGRPRCFALLSVAYDG